MAEGTTEKKEIEKHEYLVLPKAVIIGCGSSAQDKWGKQHQKG